MKRKEIDKIFTLMVNEYLAKGYTINTNTMGGSQGEIARVDLVRMGDYVRIWLSTGCDYRGGGDYYVITVGRSKKPIRDIDHETVWNSELEEIERDVIWRIGKDWYSGNEDYVKECKMVRRGHMRKYETVDPLVSVNRILPDACRKVVLERVRRLPRCKSVKLSDIKYVRLVKEEHSGINRYVAVVRDKWVTIGEVERSVR